MDKVVKNPHDKLVTLKKIIAKQKIKIFQLQKIIDYLPGDVYWKNKTGVWIGLNITASNSLRKMGFPWKKTDVLGKTDYDLFPKATADRYRKHDLAVKQSGEQLILEEPILLPTGQTMIQLSIKRPLYDPTGELVGIVGNTIDITHLKEIEAELRQAKALADAANKAKSEFIANISHDIRTPITGILGLGQTFYDNAITPEAKDNAKTLMDATHELLTLLNEIIDVVGLASGQLTAKNEDFNLLKLVNHNLDLLKPAIKHKRLMLSFTIDEKIPHDLYGNRHYLDRILLNVLSNAVKFTEKGSIDLIITEQARKEREVKLKFMIFDTGIGIPKNKQKKLFQHFSRLNPSYQGLYKGSGLGLYTVKQYLRLMRGRIRVYSEEGKGSRFTITVPLMISENKPKSSDTPAPDTPPPTASSPDTVSDKNSNIMILAVEDSPLAARTLQQILQKLKCGIDIVNNGEDAIAILNKKDYDLVLMDIGLAGIDGFETTKRIRHLADPLKADIPIIALTAHISEQMRQQCLQIGMQDMLTKPVTWLAIQHLLERYVPTKTQSSTATAATAYEENNLLTIDLENGANIGGGDMNFAKKMLSLFVETWPTEFKPIETAYRRQEWVILNKLIHKLHGSLCYCGIPKLRDITKRLQIALKENKPQEIDALMNRLIVESEEVLRVWRSLKDT